MDTATETAFATLAQARRAGRFTIRVTGSRFDYTRRYTVIDKTTGRVARNLTHGSTYERCDAQQVADRANGISTLDYDDSDDE